MRTAVRVRRRGAPRNARLGDLSVGRIGGAMGMTGSYGPAGDEQESIRSREDVDAEGDMRAGNPRFAQENVDRNLDLADEVGRDRRAGRRDTRARSRWRGF